MKDYIRKKKGACRVYMAPFDVRLDEDDRTVVQPDLSVVCRREFLDDKGDEGSPGFRGGGNL